MPLVLLMMTLRRIFLRISAVMIHVRILIQARDIHAAIAGESKGASVPIRAAHSQAREGVQMYAIPDHVVLPVMVATNLQTAVVPGFVVLVHALPVHVRLQLTLRQQRVAPQLVILQSHHLRTMLAHAMHARRTVDVATHPRSAVVLSVVLRPLVAEHECR